MRDYAKVAPRFWTGNTGRAMRGKPNQQVLLLYLITCPNANMLGLYYLPLPTIAHETGMSEIEVKAALAWLSEQDAAHYDAAQELVWVPEMATYQIGRELNIGTRGPDRQITSVKRDLETFRGHPFAVAFLRRYNEAFSLGVDLGSADAVMDATGGPRMRSPEGLPLDAGTPSEGSPSDAGTPSKPGSGSGSGAGAGAGGGVAPPSAAGPERPLPDFNAPRTSHGLLVLFGHIWEHTKGRPWYGRPKAAADATRFMDRQPDELATLAPEIRPAIERYLASTKAFYVSREHSFDVFVKDFDSLTTATRAPPANGRPKSRELRVLE